jgi:hypothetical protein
MKKRTVQDRIADKAFWTPISLESHIRLDVYPLWYAAREAIEKDGDDAMVTIGLRNRKRSKSIKLAIGVKAAVTGAGYTCTVRAADLLEACNDESEAVEYLITAKRAEQAA